ncbi:enamine deaminase RidA (YjgF/YER057c/UK114 family) [Bradyrhizobium sp. USDA 4369]
MSRRLISTGSPFEKTAGYSRAVVDGDFVFVAGTTGYDYSTMTMPADVTSQSRNCFKTIAAALQEAGFEMADIVRATYYLTDVNDADAHFAVCGEVPRRHPAGSHDGGRRSAAEAGDEGRDRNHRQTAQQLTAARRLNPSIHPTHLPRRNHS